MATANPPVRYYEDDNYEIEMSRERDKIRAQFGVLTDRLKCRERELLEELDTILACYRSYRDEVKIVRDKVRELETMKQRNEEELATSRSKKLQENIIQQIKEEIKSISYPRGPQLVLFICGGNVIFSEITKLGKLVKKVTDINSSKNPKLSNTFHFTDFVSTSLYHEFSTYSRHGFTLDGDYWRSVQHYFQAQKYPSIKWLVTDIRIAVTSKRATEIGKDKVHSKVCWNSINSTNYQHNMQVSVECY